MAYEALRHYSRRELTFRFVSNVDGTDFAEATRDLDPAETLFVVSSKTFTTLETMTNARTAREWSLAGARRRRGGGRQALRRRLDQRRGGRRVRDRHRQHVRLLGLGRRPLLDGLGDRALDDARDRARGASRELLAGFHAIDEHFREAPLEQNLPALMGLLAVWYGDFFGAQTVAVLPYDQYLKRFPAYLQQLTMESNGKHVTARRRAGRLRDRRRLLGRAGHQRPALLLPADPPGDEADPVRPHRLRRAAQPARRPPRPADRRTSSPRPRRSPSARRRQVRAEGTPDGSSAPGVRGQPADEHDPRRAADPRTLGSLVALYEHASSPRAPIWGIDSFDQWGVELGKVLAKRIVPELQAGDEPELGHDSSTNALIRRYRAGTGRWLSAGRRGPLRHRRDADHAPAAPATGPGTAPSSSCTASMSTSPTTPARASPTPRSALAVLPRRDRPRARAARRWRR